VTSHDGEKADSREAGKPDLSPDGPGGSALDDPRKRQEVQQVLMSLGDDITPKESPPESGGHPLGCAVLFMVSVLLGFVILVMGYGAAAVGADIGNPALGMMLMGPFVLLCLVSSFLYITLKCFEAYQRRDYRAAIGSLLMTWGTVVLLIVFVWMGISNRDSGSDKRTGASGAIQGTK
jgi:hypothetical protein